MKVIETIFRGKHGKNWVYGSLVNGFIVSGVGVNETRYSVNTDSISQYTTINDINSERLFGLDIVKNVNAESEAFGDVAVIEWHSGLGGWVVIFESIGQFKMLGMYEKLEKIGNYIDNPELAK